MLTERLAATLSSHEPGWRLPRRTALARRYNVTPAEIDAAIQELAARHLLRSLPDGQVYRSSPAEYLIKLEGARGVGAHIDPHGTTLECADLHLSLRRVPEDIGLALGLPPGTQITVIRCVWDAGRHHHAALSTTYLADPIAPSPAPGDAAVTSLDAVLNSVPLMVAAATRGPRGHPVALSLEMQPPPLSVARILHLSPSQPAITVTVRFDDPSRNTPIALTTAVFHADLFRIVVECPTPAAQQEPPAGVLQRVTGWDTKPTA